MMGGAGTGEFWDGGTPRRYALRVRAAGSPQQTQISQIQQEALQRDLDLRQRISNEQQKLHHLRQDRPDPQEVGDSYGKIAQLQRQQLQQNRRIVQPYYRPGQ